MPDPNDDPATLGDPDDDGEAGSEELEITPAVTQPDEAYKGLQRRLGAKDREIADLRHKIEEQSGQGGSLLSPQAQQVITGLVQELHQRDPEAAKVAAQQIRQQFLEARNAELEGKVSSRETDEARKAVEERNLNQLRETVKAIGADPDSPLIDYGDTTMYLHERIALARETALTAVAPARAVTPPKASTSDGTAHNAQPGVPPTPKAPPKIVTGEQYETALAAYRAHPCATHMAAAQKIRDALAAQVA